VDGTKLKDTLEAIENIEHYFKEMEASGISKKYKLKLLQNDIIKREDFEGLEKLSIIKEDLEKTGNPVEIIKDREHNLYSLQIVDEGKKDQPVTIDYELCCQGDYKLHVKTYKEVRAFYEQPIKVIDGNKEAYPSGPEELLRIINDKGKEGINIQRYKGLGEMNPEQLWSTTMDPERRSIIKVSIDDAVEADQVFTVLMGSNIETRRIFIEENALTVRNLDI
jgi:DNA gyrase subunit B